MKSNFNYILLVIKTYALSVGVFFIFRLILFFNQAHRINLAEDGLINILKAFFMGVRFDIVISGYILLIPALILFIMDIIGQNSRLVRRFVFGWIFLFFTLAFMICAADIPYFNQFFSRFSMGAFEWMDKPDFVFKMIIQEPKYFMIILPFGLLVWLYFRFLKRIIFQNAGPVKQAFYFKIAASIIFLGLMFIGVRGRIAEKSPIRIGTAYFSNNAFLNQLGLNPVFTLLRSYLDSLNDDNKRISLMEDQQAIAKVQHYLGIKQGINPSPIARMVNANTDSIGKPNVVVVIMESMSAAKMQRHGNTQHLTPFLDSLSYQSLYFENIYTAGKHTFNGVFGSLFSFPAIYQQHSMKEIRNYNGMASTLRKNGYSTTYFTTHDSQFDNVEGFLRANDFENIVSQADYPSEAIKTTLGVPDDFMFEFSMPILSGYAETKKPFFAAFMTASDHGPYYIPEYFKPQNEEVKAAIVEYADWSLRKFITKAKNTSWFENTIFIFVADHGAAITAPYAISLDYHHSPLVFYAPKLLPSGKNIRDIGGQIDLFPTLMGMLDISYVNNTLGIDLMNDSRPYIMINDDDKFGVLDTNYLLIHHHNSSSLFHFSDTDKTNYASSLPEKTREMEEYGKANLQVFQYMLNTNSVFVEKY